MTSHAKGREKCRLEGQRLLPFEPLGDGATHDPVKVLVGQESALLREEAHIFNVGTGKAGHVGAPECASRAERLYHLLDGTLQRRIGVRFADEAGHATRLDGDVGKAGEIQHLGQLFEYPGVSRQLSRFSRQEGSSTAKRPMTAKRSG